MALDLPGHGLDAALPLSCQAPQDLAAFATARSHLADVTLQDNVEHVVAALRRVAPYGPVILVGISMGGLTLTGVGNTAPELVSRLVYLTAVCCVELPSLLDYMQTPEAATSLLPTIPGVGSDPTSTGAARSNHRSADPEYLRAAKAALLAEGTDEQFRTALNYGMQPDESVQVMFADSQTDARTWGTIPRTYIRATLPAPNTRRHQPSGPNALDRWRPVAMPPLVASVGVTNCQFWIAEIQISDEMESKIRTRRFVTGDEVREACVPDAYEKAGWHDDPVHGRRLLVIGRTAQGVRLKIILQPIDVYDGIWRLRTVLRMM